MKKRNKKQSEQSRRQLRTRFAFRLWNVEKACYSKDALRNPAFALDDGILNADSLILEQSTGIKDDYEELIFEGDLLSVDGLTVEVSWGEYLGCFILRSKVDGKLSNGCEPLFFPSTFSKKVVIIGNIHEGLYPI